MVEAEKKQIEGKRILPITILDILQRETDATHGMEASEIRTVLERDYDLKATEKTIREHCKAMQGFSPLGRKVLRLNRGDLRPDGERLAPEDSGWAVEPYLSGKEVRLIADGIARADDGEVEVDGLIDKLLQLSGPRGREAFEALDHAEEAECIEEDEHVEEAPETPVGKAIEVKVRTMSPDVVTESFADASVKKAGKEHGKPVYEAKFSAGSEIAYQWTLEHRDSVEVLKPKKLRKALKAAAKKHSDRC